MSSFIEIKAKRDYANKLYSNCGTFLSYIGNVSTALGECKSNLGQCSFNLETGLNINGQAADGGKIAEIVIDIDNAFVSLNSIKNAVTLQQSKLQREINTYNAQMASLSRNNDEDKTKTPDNDVRFRRGYKREEIS